MKLTNQVYKPPFYKLWWLRFVAKIRTSGTLRELPKLPDGYEDAIVINTIIVPDFGEKLRYLLGGKIHTRSVIAVDKIVKHTIIQSETITV